MKRFRPAIILSASALFAFSAALLFYAYFVIQDVQQFDVSIKIGDVTGLDVNESALSFGTIPKTGGWAQRQVIMKNLEDKPIRVYIKKRGNTSKWVYPSESEFMMKPYQSKEIIFTANPPAGDGKGEYKGRIIFIFKRVFY